MIARPAKNLVVQITGPREAAVTEFELPEIGSGQVRLRTRYSGISAGTEMNVYRGLAPQWERIQDPETGLFTKVEAGGWSYPLAYGYAAVSEVEELGSGVSSLKKGDVVFSFTPHQSATVTDAASVIPLPDLIDRRYGVLFANLNTALNGVLDARIGIGDTVVVTGLGVIGLLVTQLAKRSGAALVVAVDGITHRRDLALKYGADVALRADDNVAAEVRRLTNNRGADIVLEVSGASPALQAAIRTVGKNGRVVVLSWYGNPIQNLDLSAEFHHLRPKIISSQVGMVNPDLGPLWSVERRTQLVLRLLGDLDLADLFTHEVPIERGDEAYQTVDQDAPGLVQCIVTYGSE